MVNPALRSTPDAVDSISRGWRRWQRAKDASYEYPNTVHAKLFNDRVRRARYFEDTMILGQDHYAVPVTRFFKWNGTDTDYYTCSHFCWAMQMQLENKEIESSADLAAAWNNRTRYIAYTNRYLNVFEVINQADLPRRVHCQACNTIIKKDGTFDETYAVDFFHPGFPKIEKRKPRHKPTPEELRVKYLAWNEEVRRRQEAKRAVKQIDADAVTTFHETPAETDETVVTIPASEYRELLELRTQRDAIRKFLGN